MIAGVFYQSSPELVVWHLTGLCYRTYGACAVAGSVNVFESEAEIVLFLAMNVWMCLLTGIGRARSGAKRRMSATSSKSWLSGMRILPRANGPLVPSHSSC